MKKAYIVIRTINNVTFRSNLNCMVGNMIETELMRIGVSLPDTLLNKFDEIVEKRGYSSRSEGMRDAIRSYIYHYEWINDVKGYRIGTIAVIYDNKRKDLSNVLTNIQHNYSHLIRSSVHVFLDRENCFELIFLNGKGEDIAELTESIIALKGVKFSKLTTIPLNK